MDPRKPFTVECPVGHETYPSNDYQSLYEGDFQQTTDKNKKYTDDGWGWEGPDGERYWFVAYANQWMFLAHIRPAIRDLGRAYLITGREEFAHKALVLLYRLAEVYPGMDYEDQSRYGLMQKQNGGRYPGKVLNLIWECFFIQDVAESYDAVWGYIKQDSKLQQLVAKNNSGIQSFIEANLLEEAVDSYHNEKIRGNFGMHQIALVYILLARQNMNNDELVNQIVSKISKKRAHTGIEYALYNFVFRDGIPMESPGYNNLWIKTLTKLGSRLTKFGFNVFDMARMRNVLESQMVLCIDNKYTIDVGDSGSVTGGVIGRDRSTYETAFMNYNDGSFLEWVNPVMMNLKDPKKAAIEFGENFETLFQPDFKIEKGKNWSSDISSSRLLAGYGIGILGDKNQNNTIALTYGMHGSHYHWDFLNFELFANGQKMIPDLGYPDAMNTYVPEVYTWSTNTSSHNTVVVNEKKQNQNLPGILHDFSVGEFVQTIDASSLAYSGMETYRRHLVKVGSNSKDSYVVYFFKVKGGNRHDYILHGPPGKVELVDTEWGKKLPGTYAGENVSLKEIYDNETMNDPDYTGGFYGYSGSGFQHLFNVQKKVNGDGILNFSHVNDDDAKIKMHILTTENQELYMADAYDLPRAKNYLIKHLICRSKSELDTLSNTFITVLEPSYKDGIESSAERLELEKGSSLSSAIRINRGNMIDVIISDSDGLEKVLKEPSIKTDAKTAVVRFNDEMELQRVFFSDGTYLFVDQQLFKARELPGRVSAIDYPNRSFSIDMGQEPKSAEMESLNMDVIFFPDINHMTEHPVSSFRLNEEKITVRTSDDLIIGYINVSKIKGQDQIVKSNSALVFEETYIGAYILNDKYETVGRVLTIKDGEIKFSGDVDKIFNESGSANIWIANIGVGDATVLKTKFEWNRND